MTERAHALLSASSAKRWVHCPPSARLLEDIPDTSSDAAKEGTLAHSLCELKLRKLFVEPGMPEKEYKRIHGKIKKDPLYQPEMERFTDEYVDYIQKIAYGYDTTPYLAIEKKVDYSHVAPEGFGTCDCIIMAGQDMHVIDFKYGKGVVVSAEGNFQMCLYAIGALAAYGMIYNTDKIQLHIIQPRVHNFSTWATHPGELEAWSKAVVIPAAQLAFKGEGNFRQGKWCDDCFCGVSGTCRHRAEENVPVLKQQLDPVKGGMRNEALLSNEEIAELLPLLAMAKPWIVKVEKAALAKVLGGEAIPGWKVVEGRSDRKIEDPKAAYAALVKAGYKRAMFYETLPVKLTTAETIITKEDYETVLKPFVSKPKGKPTLAPESDKRTE